MPGLDPLALLAAWDRGIRQDPLERALILLAAARDDAGGDVSALDVGSRDVLLARLLERTAGRVVWGRTACGSCGEPLDVPVDVAAIARLPVREPDALLSATVDGAEVIFRLPTSEDLRRLRGMAPAEARRQLLARCVAADAKAIPDSMAEAVEAAMEQAAPAGAIELEVGCPACGARTTTALDISVLLWAEIEAQAVGLLGDVHALAAAYGWSEAEVLALSPERRAMYLDMAGT